MNYVNSLDIYGVEAKEVPCIVGEGDLPENAPIGCLYLNENNGKIYKRVKKGENSLEWVEFESGEINLGPGETGQILAADENGKISWQNMVPCIVNTKEINESIQDSTHPIGSLYMHIPDGKLYKLIPSGINNTGVWKQIKTSHCEKYYIEKENEEYNLYLIEGEDVSLSYNKKLITNFSDLALKLTQHSLDLIEIFLEKENQRLNSTELQFDSNNNTITLIFKDHYNIQDIYVILDIDNNTITDSLEPLVKTIKYYIKKDEDSNYYLYKLIKPNTFEKVQGFDLLNNVSPANKNSIEIYYYDEKNHSFLDSYELNIISNSIEVFFNSSSTGRYQAVITDLGSNVVNVYNKRLSELPGLGIKGQIAISDQSGNITWTDVAAQGDQIPVSDGEGGIRWTEQINNFTIIKKQNSVNYELYRGNNKIELDSQQFSDIINFCRNNKNNIYVKYIELDSNEDIEMKLDCYSVIFEDIYIEIPSGDNALPIEFTGISFFFYDLFKNKKIKILLSDNNINNIFVFEEDLNQS